MAAGATLPALRIARGWQPDASSAAPSPTARTSFPSPPPAPPAPRGWPTSATRGPSTLRDGAAQPAGALNARAERGLVRRADRVVVADRLDRVVGLDVADPRRVVIHNGVDEGDLAAPSANGDVAPGGTFRLTYVGSLYGERDAAPVIDAVARLVRSGDIDPSSFEVAIVGNVWLGPARSAKAASR